MKLLTLALVALLAITMPAIAQGQAPPNPEHVAFGASILRAIGRAMIDNAENWTGTALLWCPPLSGLLGWLMPREWLWALLRTAAWPVIALLGKGQPKGGGK